MAVKTYLVAKEVTTDLGKKDIKTWEKEVNSDAGTWKVKKLTVGKLDED